MDYKVQRGDTLSALAKRHGTTVDAIMDANKGAIKDRNLIITGDTITIPEPAKAAKAAAKDVQPDAPDPKPAPRADADAGAAEVAAAPPVAAPSLATPSVAATYEVASPTYVEYAHVAPAATEQSSAGWLTANDVTHAQPAAQYAAQYEPTVQYEPMVQYAPAVAAPAPVSYEDNTYEQRVVDLVNQIRGQYGLPALSYDARLDRGAEGHTAQQAATGLMGHEGIGDGTPQDRMLAAGWNWAWGENAAVGQTTPEQVVAEWMASPGHRANILNGDFRFLSVGYMTAADGRPFWTQSFGVGS